MKQLLSWITFEIADILSRIMFKLPLLNFLLPVYNRLLYWSILLGENNEAK